FRINYDDGSSSADAPGTHDGYDNEVQVESSNSGLSSTISHTGGTIGVWLDDNPSGPAYSDNVDGLDRDPTFRLATEIYHVEYKYDANDNRVEQASDDN